MSFRARILTVSVVALLGGLAALYFLLSSFFLDEFRQVEQHDVRQKMEKLRSVIDFELDALSNKVGDWANWTDAWLYAGGRMPDFPEANIVSTTFTEIDINLLAFIGTDGNIISADAADLETRQPVQPPALFRTPMRPDDPLLQHERPDAGGTHGLLNLPEGPMFAAFRAILNSEGEGPAHGTLLFAKFIDAGEIARLETISRMTITIGRVNDPDLPAPLAAHLPSLHSPADVAVSPVDDNRVRGAFVLPDLLGTPTLLVQGEMPRAVYRQALNARIFILGALALVGLALSLIIFVLVRRLLRAWEEHERSQERIRYLAFHDHLTGLLNRHLFNDRAAMAINQARRTGDGLAALFIDLDQFKNVNDTLGHEVGDALLRQVADRLAAKLRAADSLARQSGDEFLVLLHRINSPEAALAAAQRLFETLHSPFRINEHEFHVTACIGIALFPHDGQDVDTLFRNADLAMYHAKEAGRNQCQLFSAEMNRHIAEVLETKTRLVRALEREELLLHYQPQISVRDARLTGVEALVRWNDPERGLIPPGKFIPVAEETGLIVPVGSWVLKTAFHQAGQWAAAGISPVRIGINLSARQFRGTLLAESLATLLAESRVPPEWIDLEITESVAMQNSDVVRNTLHDLRKLGITVSLDDFGTGYSSLSYLRSFPFDTVKIDRSFLNEVCRSDADRSLVTSIVSLAHSLHLQVVAEGVETPEQLAFLRHIGCDVAQGYLLSRPVPANVVEPLILRPRWDLPAAAPCQPLAPAK